MADTPMVLTDGAAKVVAFLAAHASYYQPASRAELAAHFGVPDRTIRRWIAQARRARQPVVAAPDIGGYYMGNTQDQVRAEYEAHRGRLIAHARAMKGLRLAVPELPDVGQQVLTTIGADAEEVA